MTAPAPLPKECRTCGLWSLGKHTCGKLPLTEAALRRWLKHESRLAH